LHQARPVKGPYPVIYTTVRNQCTRKLDSSSVLAWYTSGFDALDAFAGGFVAAGVETRGVRFGAADYDLFFAVVGAGRVKEVGEETHLGWCIVVMIYLGVLMVRIAWLCNFRRVCMVETFECRIWEMEGKGINQFENGIVLTSICCFEGILVIFHGFFIGSGVKNGINVVLHLMKGKYYE
jgi:hypothetical protein